MPRSTALTLLIIFALPAVAQIYEPQFPPPSNNYPLTPDSEAHGNVPTGKTFTFSLVDSQIYPASTHKITVYIPAAYRSTEAACVYVGLDGLGFHAPIVFDNLIAQHAMPITIGIGIAPGEVASAHPPDNPRFDRSFEFDSLTDRFGRFVIEEVLPAVQQHTTPSGDPIILSTDANCRAIGGGSTGGIGAFTVAWQRPDAFRRVFSAIGTYVGMRGGERYNVLVRKTEPKPLRIFLQDGANDEWSGGPEMGDWWISNETMERALRFAGYDVRHVWGAGTHNGAQADAVFPEAMHWLWRDWHKPIAAQRSGNPALQAILAPNEDWSIDKETAAPDSTLTSDAQGNIRLAARNKEVAITRFNKDQYVADSATGELWLRRADKHKMRLDTGLKTPGGLAISPDGLWLFVTQRTSRYGLSYRVQPNGTLDAKEPFYDFYVPADADDSGATSVWMDRNGLAYTATRMGVQIFDRNGRVIVILPLPGNAAADSLCFGGNDFSTLYVLSGGKVFLRKVKVQGVPASLAPSPLPKWSAG